jgi:hypothetical protein
LVGEPAVGVGQPAGGVVHVYESDPSLTSSVGNIILTGAISDHGKDHQGVAGKHHTINKIVLSKGSFEVDVAKLNPRRGWIAHRARFPALGRHRCRSSRVVVSARTVGSPGRRRQR